MGPCYCAGPFFVFGVCDLLRWGPALLDPGADWLRGVSVAGAAICRAGAAVFSIIGVASDRVFAAAGLALVRATAGLTVLRAHLCVLALAAVHRSLGVLVVFVVFAATGHVLGILAMTASHGRMVHCAASFAFIFLSFMFTATAGGFARHHRRAGAPAGPG